jgi:hypothetical protein
MARATTQARTHVGLYGKLWDREELADRNGGRVVQSSGQVYVGSPGRLAAFRAGQPVALRAWDVPESARGGEDKRVLVWRTAVVRPDGTVQIRVTTGQEMLDDLGL